MIFSLNTPSKFRLSSFRTQIAPMETFQHNFNLPINIPAEKFASGQNALKLLLMYKLNLEVATSRLQ